MADELFDIAGVGEAEVVATDEFELNAEEGGGKRTCGEAAERGWRSAVLDLQRPDLGGSTRRARVVGKDARHAAALRRARWLCGRRRRAGGVRYVAYGSAVL